MEIFHQTPDVQGGAASTSLGVGARYDLNDNIHLLGYVNLGVVTRSEKGCMVVSPEDAVAAPAFPIAHLVDTTGAGDLFASGFLFGLARNLGHLASLKLGALAAAEVIQHVGARPEANLKALAEGNGLDRE